jgi:hypothetical protein
MLLNVEPVGQRAERGLQGGQRAYQRMLAFNSPTSSSGLAC